MVEMGERHHQELERAYEMTSDQVVPWHMVTIRNAEKVLAPEGLYLPEIGDKLIKIAF